MSIDIVSRKEWGAKTPPDPSRPFVAQGMVANFFLHHTVTVAPGGDEKAEMRSIEAAHMADGSRAIDYGFCLGRTGIFYEGRGWGVQDGATATGFGAIPDGNYYGREVTVALLGNYETLPMTDALVDKLREFIALAVTMGFLTKMHAIRGHRDVRATACPGKNAYARLDEIKVPWVAPPTGGFLMALDDKEQDEVLAASRSWSIFTDRLKLAYPKDPANTDSHIKQAADAMLADIKKAGGA